jgi:SAM-dependent methyltransferase
MPKNKERYAVGLIIERHDGKTLYVHRNPEATNEYKRFWSMPTMAVDKADFYGAISSNRYSIELLERLVKLKLRGNNLEKVKFLISGSRQRTHYILHMAVFSAMSSGLVNIKTEHYDDFQFMTPFEFLQKNNLKCGTCVSLYFQKLVESGDLPSTIYYLEVPPELADSGRALEDYSPEELWRLAAPNYSLLLKGKAGGEGHLIRGLTLDRFLHNFVDREILKKTRVLDVGSGNGAILEKILKKTQNAYGLELVEDLHVRPTVTKHIVKGNLYNIPANLRKMQFDWVVLNLLLNWLPDLDAACSCVSSLLSSRGKVLVTVTPPEFTKNGQWETRNSRYNWVMTEPLRRARALAMINRTVGPLWFYPRSTIDVIQTFCANGLSCIGGKEIYIDSYLSSEELKNVLSSHPSLVRHEMLPMFTVLFFSKTEKKRGKTKMPKRKKNELP